MTKDLVSIGIPAYKATYLKEAIDSVLNQTYTKFELIIVNDKSPENIEEIISTYNDKRIRYYKNEDNLCRLLFSGSIEAEKGLRH